MSPTFLPHLIVLSLILIAALVCVYPCMSPYSVQQMHQEAMYSAYEGMATLDNYNNNGENGNNENNQTKEDVVQAIKDDVQQKQANKAEAKKPEDGKPVEGFYTYDPAPITENNQVLDKFSHVMNYAPADGANCTSSGLSNSKGFLCLTPDLITALKTRGGNA